MRSKPFLTNVVPIHGFKAISMWSTGSNCDAIFDRTLPTNVTTSKLSRSLSRLAREPLAQVAEYCPDPATRSFAFHSRTASHVWGRPVDVAFAQDGSLLFSDDGNGVIYRVSYKGR
jgi:hypothetical protein